MTKHLHYLDDRDILELRGVLRLLSEDKSQSIIGRGRARTLLKKLGGKVDDNEQIE